MQWLGGGQCTRLCDIQASLVADAPPVWPTTIRWWPMHPTMWRTMLRWWPMPPTVWRTMIQWWPMHPTMWRIYNALVVADTPDYVTYNDSAHGWPVRSDVSCPVVVSYTYDDGRGLYGRYVLEVWPPTLWVGPLWSLGLMHVRASWA